MNLVVGGTGRLGSEICSRLLERRQPVRTLVRASSSPAAVARLRGAGAEVVVGDLSEPRSLRAACRGITTVVSAVAGPRGQPALLDAARDAAVCGFVYVSLLGLVNSGSPLERATHAVEQRLRRSGLAFTILRPAFVMETWLSPSAGFDLAARRVRLYSSGAAQVSWVAARDVAAVAVACLDAPAGEGLDLCGPDNLSPLEIVELAQQIGGRSIAIERIGLDVLRQHGDEITAALLIALARGGKMQPSRLPPHVPQPRIPVRHYLRMAL